MTYFEDVLDAIDFTICLLTWREQNVLAELLARAKRARSGARWLRKFGKLSIRESLVMT